MGMSLRDTVARAGSFDALLPHLKKGATGATGIMARAEGFYNSEGRPEEHAYADGRIPVDWWERLCDVNPAANRAVFRVPVLSMVSTIPGDKVKTYTDDITAIGVELEQAAVEALFPEAPVPVPVSAPVAAPAAAPRHAGGRPTQHKWEGAAQHVDRSVETNGSLPRDENSEPIKARAVELITEWFRANDPPPPLPEDIYRWLRNNPQRSQGWW